MLSAVTLSRKVCSTVIPSSTKAGSAIFLGAPSDGLVVVQAQQIIAEFLRVGLAFHPLQQLRPFVLEPGGMVVFGQIRDETGGGADLGE